MSEANEVSPSDEGADLMPLLSVMSIDEKLAAARFNETTEDSEGYDVDKKMMRRLSCIGLVSHKGGGYYEQTDLMLAARDSLDKFRREWNNR